MRLAWAHLPFKRLARPDEESGVGKMQAACKCGPLLKKPLWNAAGFCGI
jgi:hypothetical protein